jgi:hypothetical protein
MNDPLDFNSNYRPSYAIRKFQLDRRCHHSRKKIFEPHAYLSRNRSNCARTFPAIPTLVSKEDYLNGA